MTDAAGGRTYRGLPGAFPYAFSRSPSWLFKLYVVIGGLLAVAVSVIFALSLVVLIAQTTGGSGGALSLTRAFFVVIALCVVAPIVAPVLFVARRHRRAGERIESGRYDRRLAVSGFVFVASVYVALIVSTPPAQQVATDGTGGALLSALYALPTLAGLAIPVLAALAIVLVHRRSR